MVAYEGRNYRFSAAFVLCLSLISAFFVYFPLTDTDIWWHLAAAREMIAQKSILYTDPFAYTLRNPLWTDLHWLFQCMVYNIYTSFGGMGLVLAKCCTIAIVCLCIAMVLPDQRYLLISSALFTLCIYEMRYLVLVRPVIVTLACVAIYLWILEHHARTHDTRVLWLLLPLQIIWTNVQGLFPLGFAIIGCYVLGESMQRIMFIARNHSTTHVSMAHIIPVPLSLVFVLSFFSSLLNPYGWQGFIFPIKLLERINPSGSNIFSQNISENIPLLDLRGNDIHFIYSVAFLTFIIVLSFFVNKRAFRWTHLLLVGIFLALALMAQRNALFYVTIAPMIIGYNYVFGVETGNGSFFRTLVQSRNAERYRRISMIVVAGLLLFCVVAHASVVARYPKDSMISPFRVPVELVEYLKQNPVEGRIFNSIRFGGYLIWQLYPSKQVFIDGRLIIRSAQFFTEYLGILDNPERFAIVASCYQITHVVLPTAVFDRYMPLVRWLYQSSVWDLVYADGGAVLFVRHDINTGTSLRFDNEKDIESLRTHIQKIWKNDQYIKQEALGYLGTMADYCLK